MSPGRITPVVDDHDTGALFTAAADGRLVVRVCACGRVLHLPVSYCHVCGGTDATWVAVSGRARLLTWTTVTQQMNPAYPVPYTIVMVVLEEHPQVHLFGLIDGAPTLEVDQPMEVWFERLDESTVIPQWRVAPR